MQTIPERIADLMQAIERHKRLLVLLASWAKSHEAVMERSVGALRTVRTATEQLEREVAQAEEALAKLEAQPDVFEAMAKEMIAPSKSQPPEPKHE